MALAPAMPIGTSSAPSAAWSASVIGGRAGAAHDEARRAVGARRRASAAGLGGEDDVPGRGARRRRSRRRRRSTSATCTAQSSRSQLAELAGAVERVDDPDPVVRRAGRGRRPTPRRGSRRRAGPGASASRMSTLARASPAALSSFGIGDRRADLQQQLAGGGARAARRARDRSRGRPRVSATVPGVGRGGELLDLCREPPGGEVGERHALEHVAQAGPGRDPHVDEARRGSGVGDVLRRARRAPRRAGRRRPGSRRRR